MPQGAAKTGDQSLSNGPGSPQRLRCGAFVHFPPAESGQKGRRGAFVPKAKCPPDPPFAVSEDIFCCSPAPRLSRGFAFSLRGTKDGGLPLRPASKKKRVYGRNMVPPVRSRAARGAVPQWRFRRNARDQEGSQALRGTKDERGPARPAREAGTGGECRRPISGNLLAGNLLNQKGPPQNLFCGEIVHFPPVESGRMPPQRSAAGHCFM